jgi:hypothetical protein
MERPKQVTLAVALLTGFLVVLAARLWITQAYAIVPGIAPVVMGAFLVVLLLAIVLLIASVAKGNNTAREFVLPLGLIYMPSLMQAMKSHYMPAIVLAVVGGAMIAGALYLLFTGPGKAWFVRKVV